jgi:hypothetical protein
MDGCAIIDARRRESTEPGPLWRANAATTGNVQTGAWKSRLHSGNTEQDMRNALVKSFMCDHYSKTMHWAATRSAIRQDTGSAAARNIGCTARPRRSNIGNGHFFIDCRERENSK